MVIYCHIIGTHLGNSGRGRRGERERDIPLFEKDLREMDPSSVERERGEGGNFELRASIGFVVGELDHENGTKIWQGGNAGMGTMSNSIPELQY